MDEAGRDTSALKKFMSDTAIYDEVIAAIDKEITSCAAVLDRSSVGVLEGIALFHRSVGGRMYLNNLKSRLTQLRKEALLEQSR